MPREGLDGSSRNANILRADRVGSLPLTVYVAVGTRGVKQGDALSPFLFSLFINELTNEVIDKGRHGGLLSDGNCFIELFLLLLADDVVLISETSVGLQTQLNNLYNVSLRLKLKVNMEKK